MMDGPPALISARPTVRIDGQALPLLSENIARLTMREAQGGLSSLELVLYDALSFGGADAGYGATAASPLQLGATIAIWAGDTEAPQEIFQGAITALEAEAGPRTSPLFTVLAEDALFEARVARRSRNFESLSPADIVRRIAEDHGLTPEIRDGLDAPVASWAQTNESDLAFLRRVLERVDGDLQLVGRTLQAGPCARDARASVALRLGQGLLRARITADLAHQATEVRVGGFDPATGRAVSASASAGEMGPGQGRDGPALLRRAFAERREHVGHNGPLSDAEGAKLARAIYGRRARRFVRVDATAQGDARIRVGSHVAITGVNPFFENDYAVVEATHRFDREAGYRTDFLAESAYLGAGA